MVIQLSQDLSKPPNHLLMHDHLIYISLFDELLVYLFLIMTKGENIYVNCWRYLLFVLVIWIDIIGLNVMVLYVVENFGGYWYWCLLVDINIGVYLELIVYNILGSFLTFQRKLCENFQVFIMHMFRGSFKVKTKSFLNLLIGYFVIIKKKEIVEPMLILIIPKHLH